MNDRIYHRNASRPAGKDTFWKPYLVVDSRLFDFKASALAQLKQKPAEVNIIRDVANHPIFKLYAGVEINNAVPWALPWADM